MVGLGEVVVRVGYADDGDLRFPASCLVVSEMVRRCCRSWSKVLASVRMGSRKKSSVCVGSCRFSSESTLAVFST